MIGTSLPPLTRRWVFPRPAADVAVERLMRDLRLPEALCRLLVGRGYAAPDPARSFLRPTPDQLHHPGSLAGIGAAVARLSRAIRSGETVLVHGDYDVDGICATALYVRALRMMGARAVPFVPHRLLDGYDLSGAGVRAARSAGASLILTGDCGIVAHDAVRSARATGVDVIVTDHHTPGDSLPDAVSVVNPSRADCAYPHKGLCGTGVAYKVCEALAAEIGFPGERLRAFLDLVAVATVADLMPLTGENRVLVRWGLRILPDTPNPGLRALLRTTGLDRRAEISAGQVGFVLAPRINAVGRMGEAARGVRLLLTDDQAEAERLAETLEEENGLRQQTDRETLHSALEMLERDYEPARDRGVVLAGEGWHPGVIGIVASRVVERIHRPTVMIALDGDAAAKGSARSIPGFHLFDAIHGCREHLLRFGGHRYAAGCSLRPERVEAFRAAFDAKAARALGEEQLVPEVRVDLQLPLTAADAALCSLLRHAAPFGAGNPTPVFVARDVHLAAPPRVVGTNHLKMILAQGEKRLEAIGFGMGESAAEPWLSDGLLDVAFKLEEDHWNGRTRIQARLVDVRPGAGAAPLA